MNRNQDSGFRTQGTGAAKRIPLRARSRRRAVRVASCPESRIPNPESGFAFITAIFLLVVMAAFAGFAVSFTAGAQATTAVAVQGVRAHAAAQAGVQWAAFTLRDPLNSAASSTPGDCFAGPVTLNLPAEFAGFAVSVGCTRFPAIGASPNYHEEGVQRVAQYFVTATASSGTPGSIDYVERQLQARIEVCKDPSAAGPGYACR